MAVMLSTTRLFDAELVRRYCEDSDLDYLPPTEPPDAVTNGPVTILVDRYSWGRVFYAEHSEDDRGITWIERNDVRPALPPWIEDARVMVDRPDCLGFHEGDHVCDGGVNPETGMVERACRWRSVCIKVQSMVKDPSFIDRFLDSHADSELWKLVDDRPARSSAGRKRPPRTDRPTPEQNLVASTALVQKLFLRTCEVGGWGVADNRYRSTMGQFYLVEYDRATRNPVYAMFRRRPMSLTGELRHDPGTEQGIARFLPRSNNDSHVTVQINTDVIDLIQDVVPHLKVVLGDRESRIRTPEREQTCVTLRAVTEDDIAAVAHIIVSVVEGGFLNSWGAGATEASKPGPGIGRWKGAGRHFKDPTRYREARRKFIESLRASGWKPRYPLPDDE